MDWISVLDLVLDWLESVFNFIFNFYNRFDGYIAVVLIFTLCYFLVNKILLPVFDGQLPEGKAHSETRVYEKSKNKSTGLIKYYD